MMQRVKRTVQLAAAMLAVVTLAVLGAWFALDDHRSLRYLLWKRGLYPYPQGIIATALTLDVHRDELVRGLTKEQLLKLFPDAHEAAWEVNQAYHDRELHAAGIDYLWLGTTPMAIVLEGGKGSWIAFEKP